MFLPAGDHRGMARLVPVDSIGSVALRLPTHDKSRPKDHKISDSWIRHPPSAWTSKPSAAQYGNDLPGLLGPLPPAATPDPTSASKAFQLQAAFRPVLARHSRLAGRGIDYTSDKSFVIGSAAEGLGLTTRI